MSAGFPDDFPKVQLTIRHGEREPRLHAIDRILTLVGRDEPSHLTLDHPTVSRIHASLVLTPFGLWIVDLMGRGGISIDGVRVRHTKLIPGSVAQIGPITLEAEIATARTLDPFSTSNTLAPTRTTTLVENAPMSLHDDSSQALDALPELLDPQNPREWLIPLLRHFGSLQQNMMDQFQQSMFQAFQALGSVQKDALGALRDELAELRRLNQELASLQAQEAAARSARPNRDPTFPHRGIPRGELAEPAANRANEPVSGQLDRGPGAFGPRQPAKAADDQVHLVLQKRILELQRERQTRWQKILNAIQGTP